MAERRHGLSREHWIASISIQLSILVVAGVVAAAFLVVDEQRSPGRSDVPVEVLKTRPQPIPLPRENPVFGQ